MTGDIEIQSKSGNIGGGSVDWVLDRGNMSILIDPSDILLQAVFKSLITNPMDSGYGVGIQDFLGTKYVVAVRVGSAMRMLRSMQTLSQWYQYNITLNSFNVTITTPPDSLVISFNIGIAQGTAVVG